MGDKRGETFERGNLVKEGENKGVTGEEGVMAITVVPGPGGVGGWVTYHQGGWGM